LSGSHRERSIHAPARGSPTAWVPERFEPISSREIRRSAFAVARFIARDHTIHIRGGIINSDAELAREGTACSSARLIARDHTIHIRGGIINSDAELAREGTACSSARFIVRDQTIHIRGGILNSDAELAREGTACSSARFIARDHTIHIRGGLLNNHTSLCGTGASPQPSRSLARLYVMTNECLYSTLSIVRVRSSLLFFVLRLRAAALVASACWEHTQKVMAPENNVWDRNGDRPHGLPMGYFRVP
jgi:hypothetical protein